MKAIEDAKSRLMASDLVQNPLTRTRNAHDIIDKCLAPLAAELEAAREAVEIVALIESICPRGCLAGIGIAIGDNGCAIVVRNTGDSYHEPTLLAALRAADAAKAKQEASDATR
jgi:hypothetical protein